MGSCVSTEPGEESLKTQKSAGMLKKGKSGKNDVVGNIGNNGGLSAVGGDDGDFEGGSTNANDFVKKASIKMDEKNANKMKKPAPNLCPTCEKDITHAESVKRALGSTWHPECFVCPKCKKDMRREDPVEKDGYPFHEKCFIEEFGTKCGICNEVVVGEQMEALGKTYHPKCFVCDVCTQPLKGQIHHENGKLYCNADYVETFKPRCGGCEKALAGFFIVALDQKFHKDCFTCAKCKTVLQEYEEHEGKPYCEMCDPNRKAFVCSICEIDLTGKSYLENLWKEPYCQEHDGLYPLCTVCNTMVCQLPRKGEPPRCKHCTENTNVDSDKTKEILEKVLNDLKQCGLTIPKTFPVRLVDQAKINTYASKVHKGMPSCTRFDGPDPMEILVRKGMVVEEVESAIAHEVGHIYLNLNGYPKLKPIVEEGVSEMFRVKYLEQQVDPEPGFGFGPQIRPDALERIKRVAENQSMIFGGGYRGLLEGMKSARMSLPQALEHIYKHTWFPS